MAKESNAVVNPILQVEGLSVRYGKVEALHDGKLTVGAGQIVSVIGPNGAGKSTLLNAIMGALPQTGHAKGVVRYLGEDVSALAIERRVSRGMCLVPEKRELFATMAVEDNLVLGAYRRKKAGERNFLDQLDHVFQLSHVAGPAVEQQFALCIRRKIDCGTIQLRCVLSEKMARQNNDVARARA